MKRYLKVSGLGLLAVLLLPLVMASKSVFAGCEGKTLRIGWEEWEPYEMKVNGKLAGIDADLTEAILTKAGCKFEWNERPWKATLQFIEAGDFDLTVAASVEPDREKYGYFGKGYRNEIMSLFVKKGSSSKYKFASLQDLAEAVKKGTFVLGVVREYSYGDKFDALRKNDPAFEKNLVKSESEKVNINLIDKGRLDGMLTDHYVGLYMIQSDIKKNGSSPMESFSLVVNENPVHFLFSKKTVSTKTVDEVNAAIDQLEKSGQKQKIIDKYK